jgi:hypothetical protein
VTHQAANIIFSVCIPWFQRYCPRDHLTDRTWPLPFYRIGGKILVRRSDFDTWAARFRRDEIAIDALVDEIVQGLQ